MCLYFCEQKFKGFLLFLKAFSWETDLWVTLGDFTVKNPAKLEREICIELKIDYVETKCAVLQIIITCVTHMQKNFEIRTSIKQLLTKYQILTKLPQIPHSHINGNFKYICNVLEPTASSL